MAQVLFGALGPIPDMAAIVSSVGWHTAAMFCFGAAASLAHDTHARLRFLYHRRRLDRRLARSAHILSEEMSEYRLAMGEEPEPLDPARLVKRMLWLGTLFSLPFLLAELALEGWLHVAVAALFAWSVLAWLWRRFNDPPELQQPLWPEVSVPQEAVLGALSAAAIVLFLAALLFWMV